jgi:hypothetical protein
VQPPAEIACVEAGCIGSATIKIDSMASYDIFNGDADGICALQQLRLSEPRDAELVTGIKRDIALLERVTPAAGDELTVLDISLDVNRAALLAVLAAGAQVRYFDHHYAGEIPAHEGLRAEIDTASNVCTSLIVDRTLHGAHRMWAIVAAFGDNLAAAAKAAAEPLGLAPHALAHLRELGECLNYNAYGETTDDLYYHPADLYRTLAPYADPFRFIEGEPVLEVLRQGMHDDLYCATQIRPHDDDDERALFMLPDAAWSRRVSGVFGNRLAEEHPARAHAVLTAKKNGYLVSVRAPADHPKGADTLCRQFETGGGRAGAAGINHLPTGELERFARAFAVAFKA